MYFNNTVYSARGVIGLLCYECGLVKDRMWGDTCNECREERRHQELIAAIKEREGHAEPPGHKLRSGRTKASETL